MSKVTEKPSSGFQRLARIALMIYPLVAHVAIMFDQTVWAAGYLLLTAYLNSLKFLHQYFGWFAVIPLFLLLIFTLFNFDTNLWVIYLPPILMPAWLAFVFIGSLANKQAFITKIAEKIESEPLNERHLIYTRWLTKIWGGIFLLMVCEAVFLAIWSSFEIWSWWVHIGNYAIIALLFVVEFSFRHFFTGQRVQFSKISRALLQKNWHDHKNK